MSDAPTLAQLRMADHIEVDHERELAGVAPGALVEVHQAMHDQAHVAGGWEQVPCP